MHKPNPRRPVSIALVAIGALILMGVGGAWGRQQLQARALRDRLAAQPTVAVAASSTAIQLAATATAPSPAPTATDVPSATATTAPSATPIPSTPTPTATPTSTPVPGTKPARLLIPDLQLDVPVSDMPWKVVNTAAGPQSDWEVPENAAGWAVNSALLGEPGNVVLSGHNNIFGRVFMPISQAWPPNGFQKVDDYTDRAETLNGRKVQLIGADGRRFNYIITAFYRIKDSGVPLEQRQNNGKWMDPTKQAQLTITTCWPPWSNTHRLVVVASPAP